MKCKAGEDIKKGDLVAVHVLKNKDQVILKVKKKYGYKAK